MPLVTTRIDMCSGFGPLLWPFFFPQRCMLISCWSVTHNDIDALFGRYNMLLKKENLPTILLLMKSFMDLESVPTIPSLAEEMFDSEGFNEGYIRDRDEALLRHTKVQQFSIL